MKIVIDISDEKWVRALDGTWCGSAEIPKGIPLENVLEDIKAEIDLARHNTDVQPRYTAYIHALNIVDKHIGKESE